jgi:ABC-type iron transport system FetAB permease component
MSYQGGSEGSHLTWLNVAIGLLFIVFDAVLSGILGLGIGTSLIVAALRCIVQLSIMSLVLGKVFDSHNIFAVAGIALLLNTLGAIEATFNKAKRRYTNMVRTGTRGMWPV